MRAIFVAAMLFSTAAAADQIADAKACSAITDSLQRLTCFDRAFPATQPEAVDGEQPAAEPASSWEIKRERSAIDDSPSIFAYLMPVESSGSGIGDSGMTLLARCTENKTSFLISTDLFMTDNPMVTIRLGSEPAETSTWSRSSNYRAAGLWSGNQAIPFLKKLKNNERMAVRVVSRDRQDAIFDLGNVEAVVDEIAAACSWKR